MQLTIATWNMHHSARGWSYVDRLGADIVLLQEAVPPRTADTVAAVLPAAALLDRWTTGAGRPWSAAVAVFGHAAEEIAGLSISHPGSFVAARIATATTSLNVISLYGLLEGPLSNGQTYATTTLHRALSDLTPLLDGRGPCILGGDLNASTQIDRRWRAAHRAVFARIEAFGFVNATAQRAMAPLADCPCDDIPCRHVRTHTHNRSKKPWQDDYVFVKGVELLECRVRDESDAWARSDHCPVIARVAIGAESPS